MTSHNVSSNIDYEDMENIKDGVFEADVVSVLSGDVITPDGNDGNFFDIYLDRPVTRITMPVNIRNGETYRFQVRQDMTGGRVIKWGSKDVYDNLDAEIYQSGGELEIYITDGTFDWSKLMASAGRKSFINLKGFVYENNNIGGLKVKSFDESSDLITCESPSWFIEDCEGDSGVTIEVENIFYFIDEKGDDWVSQKPFGVTMFTFYSTTEGASGILNKTGVYANHLQNKANIRFEETLTDDFANGSDDGLLNWREGNSNGTTTSSSADVDDSHVGLLLQRLNGGATGDGRTSTTLGTDMFNVSKMRTNINGICKFNENALETADVKYYFGWTDHTQWQSANDGAYFEIVADGSTEGKGRVYCVTEKANVRTIYDTGIDLVEDEWFQMFIGIPPNGGSIHFVVNDLTVHHADRSTFGDTAKITPGFGQFYDYTGTSLPNNKEWFIDAFSLKYRLNEDRI